MLVVVFLGFLYGFVVCAWVLRFWSLLQFACSGLTLLLVFVGFVGELWLWFRLVFGELLADFWFIVGLLLFRLRVACWLLRLVWRLCCTWVA